MRIAHRSGRLPGAYDFSDKPPFYFGGPRRSVARVLGANLGSTSQGARSRVFTLIPVCNGVIWTGDHNIRPFVRIVLRGVAELYPMVVILSIQISPTWNRSTSCLMEVRHEYLP